MIWKNSFFNILGLGAPLVVAFFSMGVVSRELGVERFGIFLIIFSLIGYANVFDGGMTRAVIRFVAQNKGDTEKDRKVMSTATITILVLSVFASVLIYIFSDELVAVINVSADIADDARNAFKIVPFVIMPTLVAMVWLALLEGRQQFLNLNIYKSINGFLIALLPMLAVLYQPTLVGAVVGLLAARIACMLVALFPNHRIFKFDLFRFDFETFKDLFSFGSWILVSNVVSPLMVNSDRFVLSYMLGADKVAFYAAPSELVARLGAVPSALAKTLFPLFSSDRDNSQLHAKRAYVGLIIILAMLVTPIFILSNWLLVFWLGEAYAGVSGLMLKILLVGFVFNSLARIPFSRIQAYGNSRLTALVHLAEIIPYFILLYFLVLEFGLVGAALAWSVRVIVDYIIFEYCSRKMFSKYTVTVEDGSL